MVGLTLILGDDGKLSQIQGRQDQFLYVYYGHEPLDRQEDALHPRWSARVRGDQKSLVYDARSIRAMQLAPDRDNDYLTVGQHGFRSSVLQPGWDKSSSSVSNTLSSRTAYPCELIDPPSCSSHNGATRREHKAGPLARTEV
jgi:hypothetical protein